MSALSTGQQAPWFEDFEVGDDLSDVPSITLTEGHAAVHQAIFGDRLRLALDKTLSKAVTGDDRLLANPSLVCNMAIGQSTIPTQRVLGNLFYRGLRFHRPVFIGDTVTTRTKVVALRQNTIKPGRPASGMVGLEMHVTNQAEETVLLFWRCPMVPCRDKEADTGRQDDLSVMPDEIELSTLVDSLPAWNISTFARAGAANDWTPGVVIETEARDTVTAAPEVVRMTTNMAMTHTDSGRSVYGKRLVYGGHTISMAAAQLSRLMPELASILCWYRCDHTAPVFEEDILRSRITVSASHPCDIGRILDLSIEVLAERGPEAPEPGSDIKVLDWQLAVLAAS